MTQHYEKKQSKEPALDMAQMLEQLGGILKSVNTVNMLKDLCVKNTSEQIENVISDMEST